MTDRNPHAGNPGPNDPPAPRGDLPRGPRGPRADRDPRPHDPRDPVPADERERADRPQPEPAERLRRESGEPVTDPAELERRRASERQQPATAYYPPRTSPRPSGARADQAKQQARQTVGPGRVVHLRIGGPDEAPVVRPANVISLNVPKPRTTPVVVEGDETAEEAQARVDDLRAADMKRAAGETAADLAKRHAEERTELSDVHKAEREDLFATDPSPERTVAQRDLEARQTRDTAALEKVQAEERRLVPTCNLALFVNGDSDRSMLEAAGIRVPPPSLGFVPACVLAPNVREGPAVDEYRWPQRG